MEVEVMIQGILTGKEVWGHPMVLFRHFGFKHSIRLLWWAIDSYPHRFVGKELLI